MAKLSIKPGSESVSLLVFIQDSASTTGGGKTGIAYDTGSLTAYHVRPGAAVASISLVTQTVTGAWSSGGFVEVDATNMPGVYRFDVPNAVLAVGVRSAVVMLKGASGMAPLTLEVDLNAEVNIVAGDLTTAMKESVNAEVVDALTVDVIEDSTPAHETRPTIAQAVLLITRLLSEKSVSSTTVTIKKEDGSTSALTLTLDDATNPTSITRTA